MDDKKLKQILLKLVNDIEDLRANVGSLAAFAPPTGLAAAQDAKRTATQTNRQRYEDLRKEIGAL